MQIALITMVGSIVSALAAAVAAIFGARNKATLHVVQKQMDGQLSETVELKRAVSFSAGENKQRERQELKKAVELGIKEHNGEPLH